MTGAWAVIPARYASRRFPGKPLAMLRGVPVVVRTLRRARLARSVQNVLVAADDERVARVVRAAGGDVVMTDPSCDSGTQRAAQALNRLRGGELAHCWPRVVVVVQGDEPCVDPRHIDVAVSLIARDGGQRRTAEERLDSPPRTRRRRQVDVGTLATPVRSVDELRSEHVVKCVCNHLGEAMYFSRSAIPAVRSDTVESLNADSAHPYLRHVGLYSFRTDFLCRRLPRLPPCEPERREQLEQLRWMYYGVTVGVAVVDGASRGVDTPEDLSALEVAEIAGE